MIDDPSPRRFHYDAFLSEDKDGKLAIHDGDTITVDLSLGHGIWLRKQALRLYGLNAPEITGPQKAEGKKSRDALVSLLTGYPLVIETILDKDEKYGRVLAKVYVAKAKTGDAKGPKEWSCVNDTMIKLGFAKPWDGQGAKPV